MAGYSATPLLKKIGIKPGHRIYLEHPPESLEQDLGPLPQDCELVGARARNVDVGMLFVKSAPRLRARFGKLTNRIRRDGMIWVCWPKKSSGVETDLDFNVVQGQGLSDGLVDVKVCAIDAIWSGLKFVIRKEDR